MSNNTFWRKRGHFSLLYFTIKENILTIVLKPEEIKKIIENILQNMGKCI